MPLPRQILLQKTSRQTPRQTRQEQSANFLELVSRKYEKYVVPMLHSMDKDTINKSFIFRKLDKNNVRGVLNYIKNNIDINDIPDVQEWDNATDADLENTRYLSRLIYKLIKYVEDHIKNITRVSRGGGSLRKKRIKTRSKRRNSKRN